MTPDEYNLILKELNNMKERWTPYEKGMVYVTDVGKLLKKYIKVGDEQ